MRKLTRYLFRLKTWQKLPPIPRQYSTDWHAAEVDKDGRTLMSLTHTRSPQGVELLIKRHKAKDAHELIDKLPKRKRKRNVGKRAAALARRAFGLLPYDPMATYARKNKRRG